jgi:hypothetical protein
VSPVGGSTDDGSRRRVRALGLSNAVAYIEALGVSVGDQWRVVPEGQSYQGEEKRRREPKEPVVVTEPP